LAEKYRKNRYSQNRNRNSQKPRGFSAGDEFYYNVLQDNDRFAEAIRMTTKSALEPYYNFLNEAIRAEEQKGSYQIDWKLIESNYSLKITPIYSKFKIEKPKTVFRVILEDETILKEERNRILFDEQDEIKRFNLDEVEMQDNVLTFKSLDILPKENEIVEINNKEVKYELEALELQNGNILESGKQDFRITNLEIVNAGWNVTLKTNQNIKELSFQSKKLKIEKYKTSFEKLFDGENEYICENFGNEYKSDLLPENTILKDENGFEYSWKKQHNSTNSKNDIVIQLIDNDSIDDKTISDYFFADEVRSIYQGNDKRNSFDIKKRRSEDKILILRQDWKNPKILEKNQPIKIVVDTANLKRQRDAVLMLNKSPVQAQRNLVKLFEKKNSRLWEVPKIEEITDWYVLKDESFDGTIDQRELVKKAILSHDFTILEGPPGSGKTTTILELILQLTKRGKRILLSASTHVAIDNVLERISKYDVDKNVEPLRIGREQSVGEAISHWQIDNKIEQFKKMGFDNELAQKLVLDSSNLVCGTTMGINQFPPIKDRGRNSELPLSPMFDYMIIDESSKTTFQEFLVPAMLSKKWVLVGDIKQLSPFIEQSHIVHNLNISIHKDTQRAIRIVFETLHNNPNPYIVEVSQNEERKIQEYLYFWNQREDSPYLNKVVSYSDEVDKFKLLGSDLILVQNWKSKKDILPKTHIVILKNQIENDSFFFQQNYLKKKRRLPKYSQINQNFSKTNNIFEYQQFFKDMLKDKSWAEEIAWRMIRVYERRMLKNPNSYYEKTYELLKPASENNPVERIYNMTLPSILESIQVGNGEKHRNQTTITDGFDRRDLQLRHETLKTQHRMHPDISQFSRENFYTVDGIQALQNARTINRDWEYNQYSSRAVWIDTPKIENDKRNDRRHKKEVDVIIREIEKFLRFTSSTPKNRDEESWTIAILTFYKPQETLIRESLRKFCNQPNKMSRFHKNSVDILLYTVDKFQGMEADIVFLSMVRGKTIGFMDNINRLNVALTRAKYQRVIVGDREFFKNQRGSEELKKLAQDGGEY